MLLPTTTSSAKSCGSVRYDAGMVAINCPEVTYVVVMPAKLPSRRTCAPGANPAPFTCTVALADPISAPCGMQVVKPVGAAGLQEMAPPSAAPVVEFRGACALGTPPAVITSPCTCTGLKMLGGGSTLRYVRLLLPAFATSTSLVFGSYAIAP